MKITNIDEARQVLDQTGLVVGLGVTAFPRSGLVGMLPNYQIVCISESKDLAAIRDKVKVVSLKRNLNGGTIGKLNTLALLEHETVQEYLKGLGNPVSLFVYKSSERIEKIADKLNLRLISNRSEVRDMFEDKWKLRELGRDLGMPLIEGDQLLINDLDEGKLGHYQKLWGKKLVLQITDYSKGGGVGTFFIDNLNDLKEFHGFVDRRREVGRDLNRVNVTKFIEGESASMTGCVTRYGVLTGILQRQAVDIAEVVGYKGRNGVWCGHDWGRRYSIGLQQKATRMVKQIGEIMGKKGYKGIYGVDLVVDRNREEVSMIEINSRYTGAFPIYSMMQQQSDEIPIDVWHLLEFLNVDYEMDFDAVQLSYGQIKTGGQLLLHNLIRGWVVVRGGVKAGVYKFEGGKLEYLRNGFSYNDLVNDDEFVLTDGVPNVGDKLKPGARLGRVIFKRQVMESENNCLVPDISEAMKQLYDSYQLKRTQVVEEINLELED